jgi:hypothetical protein
VSLRETLELLVTMDPNAAIGGFEKVAGKAEEAGKRTESSMSRIGAAGLKLGASGLAAGAFLTDLGSKEQAAGQQLEAAISTAGQSISDYQTRIDAAKKAQENYGHSYVETEQALTTLTVSYGDTGKALDQMQLVADLAARKHIALADAASMVAKAHGGASRLFREFGVDIQKNTDGTKNYDGALTELSRKLSGQASAAQDTFMGKLDVLRTKVEDQVAVFGEKYGPAILGVGAGLTAVSGIASGVGAVLSKVSAAHAATALAAQAQAAAEAEVAASEALVTTNSAAAVASLYAVEGATVASGAAFGPWGIAVAAGILTASEAIDIWGSKTTHTMTDVSGAISESAQQIAQDFIFIKDEGNPEDAGKWLSNLAARGDDGLAALERLRSGLIALGRDTTDVDSAIAGLTQSTGTMADETTYSAKAIDEAAKAVDGYSSFLNQLSSAMEKSYRASVSATQEHANYEAAVDNLTASLKKNGTTLDDNTAKGRNNITAVLAAGDSIAKMIEARFNETHSVQAASDAGAMYVANLESQLKAAGYNTDQIQKMIETMHLTPEDIKTTFSTNGVEQEIVVQKYIQAVKNIPSDMQTLIESQINQGQLDAVNAELDNVARGRAVMYTPWASQSTATLVISGPSAPKQYALGGPVDAPRGQMVPAFLHGGEYVMTAAEVDAAKNGGGMSHGGGGATISIQNLNVVAPAGANPAAFANAVRDALESTARRGNNLSSRVRGS